jgi:N-acetylmuramoyl-L-alanine amidase
MGISCPRIICLFSIAFSLVFAPSSPASAALVTDVRFWSAPDHTRVVLDLTEPVQYEPLLQGTPLQHLLILTDAHLYTKKREVEVNDPFLSKVTLSPWGEGRVKLTLYQKKSLTVTISTLKPYLDKPHRLVIDLVDEAEEKKEQENRKRQKEFRPKGARTVVVDPGHGGEDPGAVGQRGTMEKDVVFKIGQKLVHLLNQSKEAQAFLTRKGDYFVPLEERVKIAREYGADFFMSLHADASFNSSARGASIYCLSLSGATDEAARILADKENMSNVLGGALPIRTSIAKDPNLNQILLDLMQNNSMKESLRFAELFLDEMKTVNHLKYPTYRQANFIVLKAPDIPSALVETAFITNKQDERLLNRNDFQEKIAKTLATVIGKFFKHYPGK